MSILKIDTTLELINNFRGFTNTVVGEGTIVETLGYSTIGDGGGAQWKRTGNLLAASQSPAQLGDARLSDKGSNEWALVFQGEINIRQVGSGFDSSNDVTYANAALAALNTAGGGNLIIDMSTKVLFDTNIDVPASCSIVGQHIYNDTTDRDKWASIGSRIRINPAATIGLQNGAGLQGLVLYRSDMTFPAAGLTAAEVALYAGTAVTCKSASPYIAKNAILGFEWAIITLSTNTPRGRVELNKIDCTNGIDVDMDLGGWIIDRNGCEPILSNSDVDNIRSGIGFRLRNRSDWSWVTNNFSFQDTGFALVDANHIKFTACGADHPTDGTDLYHTGIGFDIDGGCLDNVFLACQSASHLKGFKFSTDAGDRNYMIGCGVWNLASTGIGIDVQSGDLSINGGFVRDFISSTGKGIVVNDAASKVTVVGGVSFKNLTTAMDTVSYSEFVTSQDHTFDSVTNVQTNEATKTVASAGTMTLPNNEAVFDVTGTTTLGTLVGSGVQPQKIVTLILSSGLTINNGGYVLAGAVNWVAPAGSSITLQYITGNTWREISRNEQ